MRWSRCRNGWRDQTFFTPPVTVAIVIIYNCVTLRVWIWLSLCVSVFVVTQCFQSFSNLMWFWTWAKRFSGGSDRCLRVAFQLSHEDSWPLSAAFFFLFFFIITYNNNKCAIPAGYSIVSGPFFHIFSVCHSARHTNIVSPVGFPRLQYTSSPFPRNPLHPSFSVCFHSSLMGLAAAPDYMFQWLRWQVALKTEPI